MPLFFERIRNELLIKSIREDYRDVNIESLIKDYISFEYLTDDDVSIDYSFIKHRRLKKELTIDNLQMEKARLGLISCSPNFLEFCKYAHLQLEGLFGFFVYENNNGDFNKFKIHVEEINLKQNEEKDKIKVGSTFFELNYTAKSMYVARCFNITSSVRYFINLNNARNQQVHRGLDNPINDYTKRFLIEEDYVGVRKAVKDIAKRIKEDLGKKKTKIDRSNPFNMVTLTKEEMKERIDEHTKTLKSGKDI